MHKKFGSHGSGDILVDRETETQTDILITILCNRSNGEVIKAIKDSNVN